MIIDEALKNLTPAELELHGVLKEKEEDLLMGYILKRNFYREPSQKELDSINDIYENGVTYFDIEINGKVNTFKLLSQGDKQAINSFVDKEFNNKPPKRKFFSDEEKTNAIENLKIVATVAAAVMTMADSNVEHDSARFMKETENSVLGAKTMFLEQLPAPLIRTLFDRYMEYENRIFDIFQYETVKKKSTEPSVTD